jgi:uncharacterized membrane-anchored protein YhcB (DUF1043 family)
MTSAHFIYIPMIIVVGVFLGFIFGARVARNAYDLQARRDEERRAAREARKQRKAERAAGGDSEDDD